LQNSGGNSRHIPCAHARTPAQTHQDACTRKSEPSGEPKLVKASLSWGSLWSKLFALLDPLQPEQSYTLNLVLPPVLPLVLPFFLRSPPLFPLFRPTLLINYSRLCLPLPFCPSPPVSAALCASLSLSVLSISVSPQAFVSLFAQWQQWEQGFNCKVPPAAAPTSLRPRWPWPQRSSPLAPRYGPFPSFNCLALVCGGSGLPLQEWCICVRMRIEGHME